MKICFRPDPPPALVWNADQTEGVTLDGYRATLTRGRHSGQVMVRVDPPRGFPIVGRAASYEEGVTVAGDAVRMARLAAAQERA